MSNMSVVSISDIRSVLWTGSIIIADAGLVHPARGNVSYPASLNRYCEVKRSCVVVVERSWDIKLSHPIEIGEGESLVTLRDAAERVLGIAKRISPEVAEYTMAELMRAGEGGDAGDVETATFQTWVALDAAGYKTSSPEAIPISIHDRLRGAIERARRLKRQS